jgi:hypothetical protein
MSAGEAHDDAPDDERHDECGEDLGREHLASVMRFDDELRTAFESYVERIAAVGAEEGDVIDPVTFRRVLIGLDVDYDVLEGASLNSAVEFLALVEQHPELVEGELARSIAGFWVQAFLLGILIMRRRADEGRA